MLSDKLRDGANSKAFKGLLALIVVSFVLTSIGGYLIPRLNTDPVSIGDYKISSQEWTEQYNRRAQELHRYGPQAAALLENPAYVTELKKQILEGMINNVAFNSSVWDLNIRIGDEQVRDVIRKTPAFQKDGVFNNDLYLATVRNMGMNPEYFGEQLRISLMSESVSTPLMNIAALPMEYEIQALAKLLAQKRSVNLYTVDTADIAKQITVNEEEAKTYYDQNHNEFMAPAESRFTYLLLSLDDLKKQIEVTDAALEEFFNLYAEDYKLGEQRTISHLLIRKASKDEAQRLKDVEEALAQGKDFKELIKTYSDDLASKEQDGVMGTFEQGQLAANLDKVAFELAEGTISSKIEDGFGTHFIKVDKIIAPHVPSLQEVKDKVTTSFINAKARELFNEKLTTMSDLSFENPDSLEPTAEALGLKVQDSGVIYQGKTDNWPFNTKAVQDLAFDEDVYSSGVNSNVIAIDEENSIVINVNEHHEADLREFAQIKEDALAKVKQEKTQNASKEALVKLAEALAKDIKAQVPKNISAKENIVISSASSEVAPSFSQAIFALPQEETRPYVIEDNNGVQTLAVLNKVEEGEEETLKTFEQLIHAQISQYLSLNAQNALYRQARSLSKIEYNQEAIDLVTKANE